MKLVKCIKFSHLANQLTEEERCSFLNDLGSSKPETMLRALFAYFYQTSSTSDRANLHDECIQTISTIINTRQFDEDQQILNPTTNDHPGYSIQNCTELPNNESLCELPQNVIGIVASFLKQDEYANLSQCSRSMYLDCNSPMALRSIALAFDSEDPEKPMPDLAAFPQVTELLFNLEDIGLEFGVNPSPRDLITDEAMDAMEQLKTLIIRNDVFSDDQHRTLNVLAAMSDNFCEQITTLRVDWDGEMGDMKHYLCKFKNLKYLGLTFADLDGTFGQEDAAALIDAMPDLQGLRFDDSDEVWDESVDLDSIFVETLMRGLGPKLRYLELSNFGGRDWLERIDFSKLQQLVLDQDSLFAFDAILRSAFDLCKVDIAASNIHSIGTHEAEELFLRCKSLDFFRCRCRSGWDLDAIETGLHQTKHLKRRSLKVVLELKNKFNGEWKESTIMKVHRIINLLLLSDVEDFMCVVMSRCKESTAPWISIDDLNPTNVSPSVQAFVTSFSGDNNCLVITNENCKINVIDESWLM